MVIASAAKQSDAQRHPEHGEGSHPLDCFVVSLLAMTTVVQQSDSKYWIFGLRIVGEFGGLIAIPVVVFVLVGRWLDERWATKPWMTIVAFVCAALISGLMVWRRTKEVAKEYQNLLNQESGIRNDGRK